MKKSILFPLVCLFFALSLNYSYAQDDEIIIKKTLHCGKPKGDTINLNGTCIIPPAPAPAVTKKKAIETIKAIIANKYVCKPDSCDFPSISSCVTIVTVPDPVLNNDNHWCFTGPVTIFCGPCAVPPIAVQGGEQSPEDNKNAEINRKKPLLDDKAGMIQNIYPNPSTGMVNIDLGIKEKGLHSVIIRVSDISGKQLLQKNYGKISDALFHAALDLSGFSNGLYFISVLIDGESVGSEKVSIV